MTRAFGAALLKLDESSVRIGGTFDHYDYDNVAQVGGGTINNDDRDRDVATIGTRVGHSISKTDELFGMFSYDSRDYRLPLDDFGYQKDSNGGPIFRGLASRRLVQPWTAKSTPVASINVTAILVLIRYLFPILADV